MRLGLGCVCVSRVLTTVVVGRVAARRAGWLPRRDVAGRARRGRRGLGAEPHVEDVPHEPARHARGHARARAVDRRGACVLSQCCCHRVSPCSRGQHGVCCHSVPRCVTVRHIWSVAPPLREGTTHRPTAARRPSRTRTRGSGSSHPSSAASSTRCRRARRCRSRGCTRPVDRGFCFYTYAGRADARGQWTGGSVFCFDTYACPGCLLMP